MRAATLLLLFTSLVSAGHDDVNWSYSGINGPPLWFDLGYPVCKTGMRQSPINLSAKHVLGAPVVKLAYPDSANFTLDTGHHTITATPVPGAAEMFLEVYSAGQEEPPLKRYKLHSFHFHTPGEHLKLGRGFPMEVHFVHYDTEKGKETDRGVYGVWADIGPSIIDDGSAWFPQFCKNPNGECLIRDFGEATLDLRVIRGHSIAQKITYTYPGSLTTPPCDENVEWYVAENPMTINQGDYMNWAEVLKPNSRFPQGEKEVGKSEEKSIGNQEGSRWIGHGGTRAGSVELK